MFELALRPLGALTRPRPKEPKRVDPDKWDFDPNTGEFHRVTFVCGEGRLICTETYSDRATKRLHLIRAGRRGLIILLVSAVLFAVCGSILCDYRDFNPGIVMVALLGAVYGLCLTLGAGAGCLATAIALRTPPYALGPSPIQPPGLEEVHRQKIHGTGGFASREEIDRAARGFTGTSADHETFED